MSTISDLKTSFDASIMPYIKSTNWGTALGAVAFLASAIALLHIGMNSMHFQGNEWLYILEYKKNLFAFYAGAGIAGGIGAFLLCKTISQVFCSRINTPNPAISSTCLGVAVAASAFAILSGIHLGTLNNYWSSPIYSSYRITDIALTKCAFAGLTMGTFFSTLALCGLANTYYQKCEKKEMPKPFSYEL